MIYHQKPAGFLFLLAVMACSGPDVPKEKPGGEQAADTTRTTTMPAPSHGEDIVLAGQTYHTLKIGGTIWLASNLNYEMPDSWCYGNDPAHCADFGRLYRWELAGKACAALGNGWRLPSDEEWIALAKTMGGYFDWLGDADIGDPIQANQALLKGGTGEMELPLGGWRGSGGGFDAKGNGGYFWSSTPYEEDYVWFFMVQPSGGKFTRRNGTPRLGMSCRCVKGE